MLLEQFINSLVSSFFSDVGQIWSYFVQGCFCPKENVFSVFLLLATSPAAPVISKGRVALPLWWYFRIPTGDYLLLFGENSVLAEGGAR
jgi:hypothetical protein